MRNKLLALALLTAVSAQAHTVVLYSRVDSAQAQRVKKLARAYDSVLIDVDIRPGLQWRAEIASAICSSSKVLVVWSASAARSTAVARELRTAAACKAQLVPVLLDSTPLPVELSEIHGVDWR